MGKASIAFMSELDAEWVEMMGGLRGAVIEIATQGLAKTKQKSPIDVGTFMNNWLLSVGTPDETTTESLAAFAGRNSAALAAYAAVEGFPVIYLQNSLPYALRIENGWSRQAPSGVLAMTVAELEVIWSGMEI